MTDYLDELGLTTFESRHGSSLTESYPQPTNNHPDASTASTHRRAESNRGTPSQYDDIDDRKSQSNHSVQSADDFREHRHVEERLEQLNIREDSNRKSNESREEKCTEQYSESIHNEHKINIETHEINELHSTWKLTPLPVKSSMTVSSSTSVTEEDSCAVGLPPTFRYPESNVTSPPSTVRAESGMAGTWDLNTEGLTQDFPGLYRENEVSEPFENVTGNEMGPSIGNSAINNASRQKSTTNQAINKSGSRQKLNANNSTSRRAAINHRLNKNTFNNVSKNSQNGGISRNYGDSYNGNNNSSNSMTVATTSGVRQHVTSKPSSAARSESGKYLFRPLSSRKPRGEETSRTERDIVIKQKMAEIWSKTFKSTQNLDLFLGDVIGSAAILTDRSTPDRTDSRLLDSGGKESLATEDPGLHGEVGKAAADDPHAEQNIIREWYQSQTSNYSISSASPGVKNHAKPTSSLTSKSTKNSVKPSQSSVKATPRQRVRYCRTPSYVDESLFGSRVTGDSFTSPWSSAREPKPFSFDYTDYRNKTTVQSARSAGRISQSRRSNSRQNVMVSGGLSTPSIRPCTAQSSQMDGSRPPHAAVKPRTFRTGKSTYVDESLFGTEAMTPEWKAPWASGEGGARKPLVFDCTDYRKLNGGEKVEISGVIGVAVK